MATRKNKLTTVFDADDRPFQKKVKRVQHAAKRTSAIIGKMGSVIGGIGLGVGMLRTVQHFDRIAKVATRMNMSVESLQRLSHAAELSGSSLSQLQGIMTRLERRTGEALQNATGSQAQRFRELNIEVEAFSELSPEDKIMAIADAFNALGGSERSVASLMGLLDTEVRELIPLLQNGSKGIEDMVKGITVLNREQIRSMEAANDGLTQYKQFQNTMLGGSFAGLSQLFRTFGSVFKRPDLVFGQKKFDNMAQFQAYSYRSLFQTSENRALMEKHNTSDLRIALEKEQIEIDKQQKKRKPQIFELTQTERGKPSERILNQIDFLKNARFPTISEARGKPSKRLFETLGILEGAPKRNLAEERGKPSKRLLENLGIVLSGDDKEINERSQTSGRFGEFIASATLGSGRGRSVSQSRGIRIQGLDKSVLIQEAMKKALEDLVANTVER